MLNWLRDNIWMSHGSWICNPHLTLSAYKKGGGLQKWFCTHEQIGPCFFLVSYHQLWPVFPRFPAMLILVMRPSLLIIQGFQLNILTRGQRAIFGENGESSFIYSIFQELTWRVLFQFGGYLTPAPGTLETLDYWSSSLESQGLTSNMLFIFSALFHFSMHF